RYLASLGHRRIGFVIGHPDHGAVGNRYLGYRDGLKSSGMKFDRSLVQQGYNSFESGEKCARRLLNLEDRPTAIFAANDDMAAGVMKVAHEMELSIPGDLSVAGFDDVPLARHIWPSLTTIRQPMDEMAVQATALLMNQILGNTDDGVEHTIPSTLVIRDSTGPCPSSGS
ncbi:MAG: substrate-binding domain-containing protein, partial [Gammaproteobacteria bacterium]